MITFCEPSTGERWRAVPGFEGLYAVSDRGNIYSLRLHKNLRIRTGTRGYGLVNLSKGGTLTTHRVHRLVATCFVPNPKNYSEVNHLNEDKLDNRADNLEWCSRSHNVNYGNRTAQQRIKVSIPVVQLSLSEVPHNVFPSIIQAGRETGLHAPSISACCKGKRKTLGGYKWKYKREVEYDE